MAIQLINVGVLPDDHSGDLLRNAFIKCNNNFAQLEADIAAISLTVDISGVIGLQDALDALAADIAALDAQVNGDITNINAQLVVINNTLSSISNSISILQAEDVAINNAISSINNSITNINNILNDLIIAAGVPEAPNDGQQYARQNEGWSVVASGTPSQLELVSEGPGPNIGWRLLGIPPANVGDIGSLAVDLSTSNTTSSTHGATGTSSFAEGLNTSSNGFGSHAEGVLTEAIADYSHTEGLQSTAVGTAGHGEGYQGAADGIYSHAQNEQCTAAGQGSHAEGYRTTAAGSYSHSGGYSNTAPCFGETVIGHWTSPWSGTATSIVATDTAFRVGIGASNATRKDGFRLYNNGAHYLFPTTAGAITNGINGFFFYNDTTKKLASHDGIGFKDYAHIGTVAPSSATDIGFPGEIRVTATFIYHCIAPNSWVRAACSAW